MPAYFINMTFTEAQRLHRRGDIYEEEYFRCWGENWGDLFRTWGERGFISLYDPAIHDPPAPEPVAEPTPATEPDKTAEPSTDEERPATEA